MKVSRPLVVLDLETTGTWTERDRIVEIGMVKYLPDGARETYVKRVNPGIPIPPAVSDIIGITDKDVKDAAVFKEIAAEVLSFIGAADLGGFMLGRFDLPVLERELRDAGLRLEWGDRNIYDAQKIYHLHEKRDLTAAYQFYCKKELTEAHTALGDAKATFEILAEQVKRYGGGSDKVESLGGFDYKQGDDFFDEGRKFRWWNGKLYPVFGKYAGKYSVQEIAQKDRGYLEWILSKDFGAKVNEMISNVLNGQRVIKRD
ncbi:MAG: exonuclease domain-containing protein [Candidatus Omnitrophica bacterium]|nr:exonuclease domain-containing protein [Candidatus Omnitrophota bacterium]